MNLLNKVTDQNFKRIIYISHPFGNDVKNLQRVTQLMKALQHKYPTFLFISPIHAFQALYAEVEYQIGISFCLWLLEKTDEMWVFGDWKDSKGCKMEVEYCQENLIPYKIIGELK